MDLDAFLLLVRTDMRAQAAAIALLSVLLAYLVSTLARLVLARWALGTRSQLDDILVRQIQGPIAISIVLGGLWIALWRLTLPTGLVHVSRGLLLSGVVLAWTWAGFRMLHELLEAMVRNGGRFSVVKPRTIPVFELGGRFVFGMIALYLFFLAWDVDLTAWAASAGIVGVAVGFAAQESLGNLIAGMFILMDGPYKLGDWLALENGVRGKVTEIGFRTTRILTQDDVEVVVPNRLLANNQVVNESGGGLPLTRLIVTVQVAYGSDIDEAHRILQQCTGASPLVAHTPTPGVQFVEFAGSGLVFRLLMWIHPADRWVVLDQVNSAVYKQLRAAGIEIPYQKHDVYLWNMNDALPTTAELTASRGKVRLAPPLPTPGAAEEA